MSQIYSSTSTTPSVATSYVTDVGTAIPAANVLNIVGGETNVNNDNGIRTIANPNGSDSLVVQLTNRITGTVTTTDATPTTLVSLSLGAVPGTYIASGDITAYDVTDAAGASYTYIGAASTDGTTGTEIGSEQRNVFESAPMATSDFIFGVTANTAFIQVTGIAGKTIHWSCLLNYRFVS